MSFSACSRRVIHKYCHPRDLTTTKMTKTCEDKHPHMYKSIDNDTQTPRHSNILPTPHRKRHLNTQTHIYAHIYTHLKPHPHPHTPPLSIRFLCVTVCIRTESEIQSSFVDRWCVLFAVCTRTEEQNQASTNRIDKPSACTVCTRAGMEPSKVVHL